MLLQTGYGASLLQALLVLLAISILAWVVLRWVGKRGFGLGFSRGNVKVLERVPLDSRRSLYLVKVGERVLLIGAGEGGAPRVLAKLDPSELPKHTEPNPNALVEWLKKKRS
jgi:flagellar protein FliO/FliZ